jgi:hypothetical protein
MEKQKALSAIDVNVSRSPIVSAPSSPDQELDDFSQKMHSWSGLWFGSQENIETTEEHYRVRERLLQWLKLCIGPGAEAVLTSKVESFSLATSAPFLTALIGRRATLEITRRALSNT